MARIIKFSGYYVDSNGDYTAEQLKVELEERFDLISHHIKLEEVDLGHWDDDNVLNKCNCPEEECEKYFDVFK